MVNLSSIDLNLLVVLHHVLTERSATRAARRLGVTQSAVSNALGRLRDLFDDPLVVRHARGLAPTPRAESLAPRLARLLGEVGGLLDDQAFEPTTATREFTLACADYYGMVVVPPLAAALRERAPRASLRVVTLEQLVAGGGLAQEVDVHVGRPPTLPAGCRVQPLFDERFVCLTRKERGVDGRRMGLRAYAAAEHVRVRVLDSARDPIDTALEARGITRNVALTVPHFSLVPLVVLRTGWVATMSERLARLYAGFLPLALRPPPFSLSARPVQMLWHERTHEDPAARFFRALVLEVSRR
ncbi:MAG: LysR family transcriptional regulator [Myxococcales bacterium]|nr:LysR family transcriptional regulator [Myxococcales bacterium]